MLPVAHSTRRCCRQCIASTSMCLTCAQQGCCCCAAEGVWQHVGKVGRGTHQLLEAAKAVGCTRQRQQQQRATCTDNPAGKPALPEQFVSLRMLHGTGAYDTGMQHTHC
jgi:hypothetical protein